MSSQALGTGWRRGAVVATAVILAACSARDSGPGGLFAGGGDARKPQYTTADFAPTGYCPPIRIRPGTENLSLYERGHDEEPSFVRYLASIRRTARECHASGGTLSIKTGISGRVVAGPKGGPGTVTLPLRIVVARQTGEPKPLYSQLFKIPVTLSGGLGADFDQVFDQVSVNVGPEDRDLIVYVGFDEGPKQ